MSILVVCPGCRKRFSVSDKFAGQSGPCPNCKRIIKVPDKSQQVQVHAPEEFASGGRSVDGQLVTKPIARSKVRLNAVLVAGVGAAVITVLLFTFVLGRMDLLKDYLVLRAAGVLLISPPLVVAGYSFLRDEEKVPYRGQELYVRAAICGLAYVVLWGLFGHVLHHYMTGEIWNWLVILPLLIAAGALGPLACLDMDFSSSALHYAFYLLVTIILRWVGGMGWIWDMRVPPL